MFVRAMKKTITAIALVSVAVPSFAQDMILPKAGYSASQNYSILFTNIFKDATEFDAFVTTSDLLVNLDVKGDGVSLYEDEDRYDVKIRSRDGQLDDENDVTIFRLLPGKRRYIDFRFPPVNADLNICFGVIRQKLSDGTIVDYTAQKVFRCEELRLRAGVEKAPWAERHEQAKKQYEKNQKTIELRKKLK